MFAWAVFVGPGCFVCRWAAARPRAPPPPNFACNSPTTISNLEFRSLELQRFQTLLKLLPIELQASFWRQRHATTHGHRDQSPPPPTGTAARPTTIPQYSHPALTPLTPVPTPNFARNSPTTTSNIEFRSLELQRFQPLLKLLPIELHASFWRQRRATTHGTAAWPPHPHLGPTGETKFALLGSTSAQTRQNSPSTIKTPQNQRFFASRANFVSVSPRIQTCWASFFSPMSIPGFTLARRYAHSPNLS